LQDVVIIHNITCSHVVAMVKIFRLFNVAKCEETVAKIPVTFRIDLELYHKILHIYSTFNCITFNYTFNC